jgi:hypothetical protein
MCSVHASPRGHQASSLYTRECLRAIAVPRTESRRYGMAAHTARARIINRHATNCPVLLQAPPHPARHAQGGVPVRRAAAGCGVTLQARPRAPPGEQLRAGVGVEG